MKNNILIIGAAGNVCLEVIKFLSRQDIPLRVAARNPDRAKTMKLKNVEVMQFDYCNPDTFDPVFSGIQSVLFVSPPAHYNLHNCSKNAIDHAISMGVKYIINISSMGIHDESNSLRIIENHIENSGLSYTLLRPNLYMQYFSSYFRQWISEDNSIQIPAGEAKTSYVDMRDVAECAANLLRSCEHENSTYLLTGKKSLNLFQVAEILSEILGRKINYFDIEEEDYRLLLRAEGWRESSIDASIDLCRNMRDGLNSIVTKGVKDILGREPVSFEKYVTDYAEAWKEIVNESTI